MKKIVAILFCLVFIYASLFSQKDYELGIEFDDIGFSQNVGRIGLAIKFSILEDESMAFGPSIRFNRRWFQNHEAQTGGGVSYFGGGGFFHYRTLDWFFLGAELEYLKNPLAFNTVLKDNNRKWGLTGLIGGGISRETPLCILNLGVFYDVVDALRNPLIDNPSPLSESFTLRTTDPQGGPGKLLPIIYRVTFFFPLGK